MRKLFLLLGLLALSTLSGQAVPARGGVYRTFVTAQGDSLRVELQGDEHLAYWRAADGRTFRLDDGEVLHEFDLSQAFGRVQAARRLAPSRRVPLGAFQHFEGQHKGLIILANFQDRKFADTHDHALYENVANTPGFTNQMGFKGSVRDYFLDQSRGLFDFSFDVVGPVELSREASYYGQDSQNGTDGVHTGAMIAEACLLAADSVQWSDYDWDGDGEAEQVFVLYAGRGQHNSGVSSDVWPHMHYLSESDYGRKLQMGDTMVDTYACSCEMQSASMVSGVGVICHEFSHCFGFPEHYDASRGGAFGMNQWDIMGYGNYNGNEFTPAGYTSFERWVLGWLEPIELRYGEVQVDAMAALSEGGEAYIVYNDANPDEYYLLENRQQTGWDAALPGRGLLILHVDFDQDLWSRNAVNAIFHSSYASNDHQRMTIFHADNDDQTTSYSLQRDPYPYSQRDSLTDTSRPAATLYTPNLSGEKLMGKPVTRITRNSDLTMSFHFSGGEAPADAITSTDEGLYNNKVRVFSLEGRLLRRHVSPDEALCGLPAGLYLVDGKKMVKK